MLPREKVGAFIWVNERDFFLMTIKTYPSHSASEKVSAFAAMPETVATRRVRNALAANHIVKELRTPRHTSLVLRPAAGRIARGNPTGMVLMKDGVVTAFGHAWERETGTELVQPVSWANEPFRVGNVNWIDIPGQGRRRLSSWVRGKEVLTAFGKRYYRETGGIEYIINVPVVVSIKGRNGKVIDRPESTIPIEWHGAPHQSHLDFVRNLKAVVRKNFLSTTLLRVSVRFGSCTTSHFPTGRSTRRPFASTAARCIFLCVWTCHWANTTVATPSRSCQRRSPTKPSPPGSAIA